MDNWHILNITNKTGRPQTYIVYADAPVIEGIKNEMFIPILYATPQLPPGGKFDFRGVVRSKYAGATGVALRSLATGSQIQITRTVWAWETAVEFNLDRGFGPSSPNMKESGQRVQQRGQLQITASNGFSEGDAQQGNVWVGAAVEGLNGRACTYVLWKPQPGASYKVQPQTKYRVAVGERGAQNGRIIDPSSFESQSLFIDFSVHTNANVQHTASGELKLE